MDARCLWCLQLAGVDWWVELCVVQTSEGRDGTEISQSHVRRGKV